MAEKFVFNSSKNSSSNGKKTSCNSSRNNRALRPSINLTQKLRGSRQSWRVAPEPLLHLIYFIIRIPQAPLVFRRPPCLDCLDRLWA